MTVLLDDFRQAGAYRSVDSARRQLAGPESLLRQAGFQSRILDFALHQFTPLFLENLEHILQVEGISDAYHFGFRDEQVMMLYLVEASRKDPASAT